MGKDSDLQRSPDTLLSDIGSFRKLGHPPNFGPHQIRDAIVFMGRLASSLSVQDSDLDVGSQIDVFELVGSIIDGLPWYTAELVAAAQACLSALFARYSSNRFAILERAISERVPLFLRRHASPYFQGEDSRVRQRPAGGNLLLSSVERPGEQELKSPAGLASGCLLVNVLHHLQSEELVPLLPGVVPPLFTFLDHHDPDVKLIGMIGLSEFLTRVDAGTLQRRGLDGLYATALRSALGYRTSAEHAQLVHLAIRVQIQMIDILLSPVTVDPYDRSRDEKRFHMLIQIVEDTILPICTFSLGKTALLLAAVEGFLLIAERLRAGLCIHLKTIVPSLTVIAKHTPVEPQTLKLHTATSQALEKVLTLSKGVAGWGTTSAVALATVWTNLHESASGAVCLKIDPQNSVVLEGALKSAFTALTSQSPGDVRLKKIVDRVTHAKVQADAG